MYHMEVSRLSVSPPVYPTGWGDLNRQLKRKHSRVSEYIGRSIGVKTCGRDARAEGGDTHHGNAQSIRRVQAEVCRRRLGSCTAGEGDGRNPGRWSGGGESGR